MQNAMIVNEPIPPAIQGSTARKLLFVGAALLCLTPLLSAPSALVLGAVMALTMENPFGNASQKFCKWLLQGCVVLLGFGMDLPIVLRVGASGALFSAASIGLTLLLGYCLGRRLKINPRASLLISAGTAICGGSAIAAVGSALDAEKGEMTVAMGTVFLLNAAALYMFPTLGHAMGLSQHQFGTWAGVAIHDVSSVVGAAQVYGLDALQVATAVKLSRALWIVPLAFGITLASRRRPQLTNATFGFNPEQASPPKVQIPWFIGLFLLASIARSFVPGVAAAAGAVGNVATAGMALTLFLVGAGLSARTLKAVGWKALLQGLLLWVFISIASLLVIVRYG